VVGLRRLIVVTFSPSLSLDSVEETTSSGIISGCSGVMWVGYWGITGEVDQCVDEPASLLPAKDLLIRVTSRPCARLLVVGGVGG
jgi:hypothetical protein